MKTSELIRQLQEADPSGDLEVTVGKTDIHFVEVIPGYYDGCHEVLKRDPTNEYYNIIGAEIRGGGKHVCINELSVRNAIWTDPDLPVTFDGEYARQHRAEWIEKCRAEVRATDLPRHRRKAAKDTP